ncbi:MAG TPA: CPBP family intramembrane glutamic endopeptidase [Chloroflexota bacterium]
MKSTVGRPPSCSLARSAGLTLAVGLVGLGTHWAAKHLGWDFPSFGYAVGIVVWKLATLGLLAHALWRYEGRALDARALGLTRDVFSRERRATARVAGLALLGTAALWFAVAQIPGLGTSLASAETYGQIRTVSAGVLLLQVLVAYPLTVLAEEAFFRGFLQPRLPWAPPVLSGVLWAVHHLQQASTIPSLVPLGVALGIIRWWTGDVRVSGLVHYAGDVAFFLSSYTVAERL